MKIGVVIGRWQVPDLHDGHTELLRYVRSQCDVMVLLVGISRARGTKRNPLDFQTRRLMLQELCPNAWIWGLLDEKEDSVWSKKVDQIVGQFGGEVTLYGCRDSFIPHYQGKHRTVEVTPDMVPELNVKLNGTQLREAVTMSSGSAEFRRGVIYAANQKFPQVYPTVDIVLINNGKFLVGRKPGESQWRFPGGFVDPKDDNLSLAATRELQEETGIYCGAMFMKYLGSFMVKDWRYRHDERIMTTAFISDVTEMNPVAEAGDDLEEVAWKTADELECDITTAHIHILRMAVEEIPRIFAKKD